MKIHTLLLSLFLSSASAFNNGRFLATKPTRSSRSQLCSQAENKISSASVGNKEDWITESLSNSDALPWNDVVSPSTSTSQLSEFVKGPKECLVFDTTLRDGTQGEQVSASCDDKLKIATRLAAFGVDYIEAGWPGSNPKGKKMNEFRCQRYGSCLIVF